MVKGPTLFSGYFKNGHVTLPLDVNGFFQTGDRGYFNPEGNLVILGRNDRMFISGGENIFPENIESQILLLKGVISCHITPEKDIEFGLRPVADIKILPKVNVSLLENQVENIFPKHSRPVLNMTTTTSHGSI